MQGRTPPASPQDSFSSVTGLPAPKRTSCVPGVMVVSGDSSRFSFRAPLSRRNPIFRRSRMWKSRPAGWSLPERRFCPWGQDLGDDLLAHLGPDFCS
jgi:hypothetical protein